MKKTITFILTNLLLIIFFLHLSMTPAEAKSKEEKDSKKPVKLKEVTEPYQIEKLESSLWCEKGYNAMTSGRYSEAIESYTKAIELNHPHLAFVYHKRGMNYSAMKLLEQAIKDFTYAIELEPNVFDYYKSRAYAYLQLNKCADAIADCNTMLQMYVDYEPAYTLRAFANQCLGDLGQAIRDFDRAIQFDPKDASLHLFRGLAYYRLTNYNRALADFNIAIDIDGTLADAYYSRAQLLMNPDFMITLYFEKDRMTASFLQAQNDMRIAARLGNKEAQNYLSSRNQQW